MEKQLKINLSSIYDTDALLELLEQKKKNDETKKKEEAVMLYNDYSVLVGKLTNLFIELKNLSRLLDAIGYIDRIDGYEDYKRIKYINYDHDSRGKVFSHTIHCHFMRIEFKVSDGSIHFYNIESDTSDENKTLEWKIFLLKEFLELYPGFIQKMSEKIQAKL